MQYDNKFSKQFQAADKAFNILYNTYFNSKNLEC